MKTLLAVSLSVLNASALANPILLFTPGPQIAPDYLLESSYTHSPRYKAAHAIVFNSKAFGASLFTVEVKGKAHTFVMHKSEGDWTPISLWEGEEEDDTYSERPRIALRSWGKTGFSTEFFLPPTGYFVSDAATPTLLYEFQDEYSGVHRGPWWIGWLRLAAFLILLGCIVGFGGAALWRQASNRWRRVNAVPAP